jgi:hypothetical protein
MNDGCKASNASEKLSSSMLLSGIDCIGRLDRFGSITRSRNSNLKCGRRARLRRCRRMRRRLGHDRISQGSWRILQFFVAGWQVALARRKRSGHHPVTRGVRTAKRCGETYATLAALTQTRLGTKQRMRNKHMKWSRTADFHLIPNRRILGRVEGVAAWSSSPAHERLDRSEQRESISQLPNTNSTTDASFVSPFAGASW